MRGDRTDSAEPNLPDELLNRASDSPEYQEYLGEVMNLQGLREHPGWLALKEHFERGQKAFEHALTARLMQGEKVSQSEIDFWRGATQVAREIFARPETVVNDLAREAHRLFEQQARRELADEGVQSLYIDE